jgi:hypothetical protein
MHTDMFRDPGMGGMVQHMYLTPLFTQMRFGRWDDVLAEPAPPQDLTYMRAIWHAARGFAHVAQGRAAEATTELAAITALRDDPSLKPMYVSSVNVAASIVAIAADALAGQIAVAERDAAEATRRFAAAVATEDTLIYMEPPDWPIPARQLQGAALLDLGRAADAERAFRQDLVKFPLNGWSLSGLQASLARQRKTAEAAVAEQQFREAWQRADVQVTGGRVTR